MYKIYKRKKKLEIYVIGKLFSRAEKNDSGHTGLHSISHLGSERKAKEFQGWTKAEVPSLPLSEHQLLPEGLLCISGGFRHWPHADLM